MQLMHADQVQRKSVFTTGMPGTGKKRSLAIACIVTAAVAQCRVIYATVSNEPVRSVMACLDEMLSDAHDVARAAFRRIPAEEESKRGSVSLDLECHITTSKALANVMMIALTYGKLESGLVTNERNSWTPIRDFVETTWLHARDKGQQAGMPVVSRHSAHIRPSALEMWIGDLKQPIGGVSKEQEEISALLQRKRSGLRMLSGKPMQPGEICSFIESHILAPALAELTPLEEEQADGEEALTPEQSASQARET